MPKSKEFIDSSDSEEAKSTNKNESLSDEDSVATTSKKTKVTASSRKSDPPAKRTKTSDEKDAAVASKAGPNGERLYEIGKSRYISVSEFRGKPYINIREYYEDKGVEKPGKKGISLAGDQWEKLKSLINQVDKDLKKSK